MVSVTEPSDDTPTGKLLEAVIGSLDEFYPANLDGEVSRGMRESVSRGFHVGSYAPYGYQKVKVRDGAKERAKLTPEPHQAQVVRRMFRATLEGKGLKDIVKGLNAEEIAGLRGRGWTKDYPLLHGHQ